MRILMTSILLIVAGYLFLNIKQNNTVKIENQSVTGTQNKSTQDVVQLVRPNISNQMNLRNEINYSFLEVDNKRLTTFEEYQKEAQSLNLHELQIQIKNIEYNLNQFVNMDFDQFNSEQLIKYNELNRKKLVFIKNYIFKKYAKYKVVGQL